MLPDCPCDELTPRERWIFDRVDSITLEDLENHYESKLAYLKQLLAEEEWDNDHEEEGDYE